MTNYQTFQANFDAIADRVYYLKDRWADEREYEDFAEYSENLSAFLVGLGTTAPTVSKSFKLSFNDGFVAQFYADGRVKWNTVGQPIAA